MVFKQDGLLTKQNGKKQMWKHLGLKLDPKYCKLPLMIKRLFSDCANITETGILLKPRTNISIRLETD